MYMFLGNKYKFFKRDDYYKGYNCLFCKGYYFFF